MRLLLSNFLALGLALSSSATPALTPTRTTPLKRWNSDSQFVSIENGQFIKDGEPFRFIGTNAYWLPALNTDKDINTTFQSIKAAGIKVVRTWAFNDVDEIPKNGTWFQLIQNGTAIVNEGPNGLQKLDTVVQLAEENDMLLILSLTNNWNPRPLIDGTEVKNVDLEKHPLGRRDVTIGTNNSLLRNTLSNDYGGIDAYVRGFGSHKQQHDEFYLNDTIIDIFKNYTTQIVKRYINAKSVLAYEIANDPRCNSSISASNVCNTTTVTSWHADIAEHIASIDPNHIVSSGAHGFACADCPKLFPIAPAPSTSAVPSARRKRSIKPFTNEGLIEAEKARRKVTREAKKRALLDGGDGMRIRGRWIAARQTDPGVSTSVGPAFDGSTGVDSQDILNIPNIGFGSFQLFPDMNDYFSSTSGPDPNLPAFNNTVQAGVAWIQTQAQLAQEVGKPAVLSAFGLVSQANIPFFVPFNSSVAPFNNTTPPPSLSRRQNSAAQSSFGASNTQLDSAYTSWISAAAAANVAGVVQYQWGQDGLSSSAQGSSVDANDNTSGVSANSDTSGTSPNDGLRSAPTGDDGVQAVLTSLTSLFD